MVKDELQGYYLGTGKEYDRVMANLKSDISQGKIQVVVLVSSYKESISYLDGKKIILPMEINEYEYDYLLIANKDYEEEIRKNALNVGVDNKKVIGYNALSNDLFDFDKYIHILKSNISIVSDDCWGGSTYNSLSLPFNSPFINLFPIMYNSERGTICDDYYKLLNNLEYYLSQPLKVITDGNGTNFPMGSIGDVRLNFNHYSNFEEAKKAWDRRVKRFNFKNYIVKKTIYDDDDAKRFSELPIKNKVGFYNKELKLDGIICLKNFNKSIYFKSSCDFGSYVRALSQIPIGGLREYDIFKLLIGENDFLRCK